jgi:hypothetical protein
VQSPEGAVTAEASVLPAVEVNATTTVTTLDAAAADQAQENTGSSNVEDTSKEVEKGKEVEKVKEKEKETVVDEEAAVDSDEEDELQLNRFSNIDPDEERQWLDVQNDEFWICEECTLMNYKVLSPLLFLFTPTVQLLSCEMFVRVRLLISWLVYSARRTRCVRPATP